MQAFKPLNRKLAIALALVGMWLLSCIGVFIVIHSYDWIFIGLDGYDATTIMEIGGFYLAWAGAQFPAACFAGVIISLSDFPHPLRTTFWTVADYRLCFTVFVAFHWPWTTYHNVNQSIPILAHLISVLLLIGISIFVAWLMQMLHKVFRRYFTN